MPFSLDVLLPHFKDPAGLKLSLDSIAAQIWGGKMRVVIVDDGSPEPDRIAAEAYARAFAEETDIGLTFLVNAQNLGRPRTRNRLLDAIEADYVAWLDAGDIWYPQKLEVQFAHLTRLRMQGNNIDQIWLTCSYDWKWEGNENIRSLLQVTKGDQVQELLDGARLRAYLWTLLGTRRAFQIAGRFDERLPRLQDLDYFLRFVRAGGRIITPPEKEALCCYFKSDVGRNAREINICHRLILAKQAPVINEYSPALQSKLNYKANSLAARFARNNQKLGLWLFFRLCAIFGSPRHSLQILKTVLLRKVLR
ncbi:glycosyltransferase [Cypionkella sp.]|uniref:glycosyltransferase family 2 protein n=1 Tax=Cypionkella sp. TaxID=2811411 RepID=UPI002617AF5C|nr:glycosyltransferase [Cypionkella sp.]